MTTAICGNVTLTATPRTPAALSERTRASVSNVPFVPTTTVAPRSAA